MNRSRAAVFYCIICLAFSVQVHAQNNNSHNPTWWAKYQYLSKNAPASGGSASQSLTVGSNVDVSNECGPQSETYVTLNTAHPKQLAAGSNEIFSLPMRGYFSSDGGLSWND